MKKSTKVSYQPNQIEQRWQDHWAENKTFSPNLDTASNPYFNLMMFPYPSAEGMHVGNMYAFTGADVYARFQRMHGYQVLEPIGLDGFGIHSENYALKVGRHPQTQAEISEKNFFHQLKMIGNGFDWDRTVKTYDASYYKWTQWLFIQMFKHGLAYRKKAQVNWCPSCKTVLSDEQVIAGECERCGSIVEKRNLEQWFFRITDYSQRLLDNLKTIDWSERVKIAQKNWIGRSEGARIRFSLKGVSEYLEVFTTRPDTLFGATFMVVSPEHPIVKRLIDLEFEIDKKIVDTVSKYIESSQAKTEAERTDDKKEKTGVFTGLYAINPVNNKEIPVWVADYVLMGYGTGSIMAVPAHDERDYMFARAYDLPIIPVISSEAGVEDTAYTGSGEIINSDTWNGLKAPDDMEKILAYLVDKGIGSKEVNYHLRDWLISRQRYWGPPIPMVFCSSCAEKGKSWFDSKEASTIDKKNLAFGTNDVKWAVGWYPVEDKSLPVELPFIEDFKPLGSGKAPLANHPEFYNISCPECGSSAERETDVSDTFLDSAWYFLRYTSTDRENVAFDTERVRKWLPVNIYIGGAEHSVLHLLYARFVTMALNDFGFIDFEEPFTRFFAHGLIIKEGAKMSKSKGNVIVPDEYIAKYGADTLRMYLMFLGPFEHGGDFYDTGIEGMFRFTRRIWNLYTSKPFVDEDDLETVQTLHRTIKAVTEDLSNLSYNTAIARLMEFYNVVSTKDGMTHETACQYIKLFAPLAPHMTEELWHTVLGNSEHGSIHFTDWPVYDESYLTSATTVVVVQVNGKRRGEIVVASETVQDQSIIEEQAHDVAQKYLEGQKIVKTIYVPGKIINFVIQ